jgi:hypothetical protein
MEVIVFQPSFVNFSFALVVEVVEARQILERRLSVVKAVLAGVFYTWSARG